MALWRRKYYNSINLYAQHICRSMSISPLNSFWESILSFLSIHLFLLHFFLLYSSSFLFLIHSLFLSRFGYHFIDLWEAKHLQLIGVSMLLPTMMISSTPLIFFHSHQGHIHDIYCIIDDVACNICRSEYMYNVFQNRSWVPTFLINSFFLFARIFAFFLS